MEDETPVPFKQFFPTLSLSSFFWVVILISFVIFSILGYFVGVRVSKLPSFTSSPTPITSTSQQTAQITKSPYDDNDADYSNISGSFTDNTDLYDQFVVFISPLPGPRTIYIDSDNRAFNNPHIGIQYPYMFSRLNPFESYVVSASACYTNPKTFALVCAKNIKITKCSGTMQGSTCVIKGTGNEGQSSGEVDFLLPGAANVTKKELMKYLALLRGINVGGNKKVPMAELKRVFENLDFTEVKTLLNSGNVVFSTKEIEIPELKNDIEQSLTKTFGFEIPVIIRPQKTILELVEAKPFKNIEVNPNIRLYVTFLSEIPKSNLKIPYESENKDLRILRVSNLEICSIVVLSSTKGTLDLMGFIEKEFGKTMTTRNWNTVKKLAAL